MLQAGGSARLDPEMQRASPGPGEADAMEEYHEDGGDVQ